MQLETKLKKIGVFGIQQSGKTHFARALLSQFKAPFIYRVTGDFDNVENAVIFKPTDKYLDLELFLQTARKLGQTGKIDAVVIDEFDLFATGTRLEEGTLNEMVLMHAHWGISVVFISRRPQDIPAKVRGTLHVIVVFMLEAPEARRALTDLHSDYDLLLPSLSFERHNFILKELGKAPVLCAPL